MNTKVIPNIFSKSGVIFSIEAQCLLATCQIKQWHQLDPVQPNSTPEWALGIIKIERKIVLSVRMNISSGLVFDKVPLSVDILLEWHSLEWIFCELITVINN
mgnify:CR=1 FL=1